MAYAPTTPVNEATPDPPSTTDRDIDTFKITQVAINIDPVGDSQSVQVRWSKGYMDGGSFVPVHSEMATIDPDTLSTKMAATVPASTSYYDAIKNAVWDMLVTDEKVAAGSVS